MKLMYDSVDARAIPADAEIVAGYVDGRYAWSEADWARFPNARKLRIAVFPWTNDGDVLDVEPGDARPEDAPAWIRMRQAAGVVRPTIYCSQSDIIRVQAACAGLEYDIWSAHYTGQPHVCTGAVATQYADPAMGSGGHFDVTLCSDVWPRQEAPTTNVVCVPVPEDYRKKFGVGPDGWPAVAANLEGIIHELVDRLERIKELVNS